MNVYDIPRGEYVRLKNTNIYRTQPSFSAYPTDELGSRCAHPQDGEYELITPPPYISEKGLYTAKVTEDGHSHFRDLILTERGGRYDGFRRKFPIQSYSVSIPISFNSTDARVGKACIRWTIRSGQFFTKIKNMPNATWSFDCSDKIPVLKISSGTEWIKVKAQ